MREIIKLTKTGGSLTFHLSKACKKERLEWKAGEYFTFRPINSEEAIITRINLVKKNPESPK